MCMRMMSVPLPPDMKGQVVGQPPYQIRYDIKGLEDTVSEMVETKSYDDFTALLKLIIDRSWARVTHIRIGNLRATLMWSEVEELPDSPI